MNFALGFDKVKDYVFDTAKGKVMKQTNGLYPAPLRILDVIRAGKRQTDRQKLLPMPILFLF